MDISALGSKIRAMRDKLGMSQEELAGRAKVARRAVQELELGRGNPTVGTIEALGKVLGEPLIRLSEAPTSSESPAAKSILQTIWAAWPNAPPEVRALCLYILTDHVEYVSLLPKELRAKVLSAARLLGLNAPKEIS